MKVREFNALKKQVKEGNVKRLKEAIGELTLKQAQAIEDLMYDLELTDEMNEVLDELVIYIDSLIQADKVANKKAAPKTEKEPEQKTEVPEKPAKPEKTEKPANKVKVGDIVYFRVEGEEKQHEILIIYKGKTRIIGIMKEDEKEVFLIRKTDFNNLAFEWTDRHNEKYNIIVTL